MTRFNDKRRSTHQSHTLLKLSYMVNPAASPTLQINYARFVSAQIPLDMNL